MTNQLTVIIKMVIGFSSLLLSVVVNAAPEQCSYSTYKWNVVQRKAVDFKRIVKPYASVEPFERDGLTGCSLCEEDQVAIKLHKIPVFRVCYILAPRLKRQLSQLIKAGEPINEIIGYRVGITRGKVDESGNRTKYSNHAFGIALDINPEHNGLYDNCFTFTNSCRLLRGGFWQPEIDELSLTREGAIVKALTGIGLRWGGEIEGKQKDFMHFSPSGY